MEDDQIMKLLPTANQKEIESVYRQLRAGFRNTLMKIFNCDEDKALSVYPEAFTNFYFNIKKGKISNPLRSKLISYLIAIGKNVYRNRYFNAYHEKVVIQDEFKHLEDEMSVENIHLKKENAELVRGLLKQIGEPCRQILKLFYFRNYSIESIKSELNMISEGAVRKKKFDCILELRKMMSS